MACWWCMLKWHILDDRENLAMCQLWCLMYVPIWPSVKHYIICGPEFGEENIGKQALIVRVLYGGKISGADFWHHLCSCCKISLVSNHAWLTLMYGKVKLPGRTVANTGRDWQVLETQEWIHWATKSVPWRTPKASWDSQWYHGVGVWFLQVCPGRS